MISSLSLDKICAELAQRKPDWEQVKLHFEQVHSLSSLRPLSLLEYAQEFSELLLDISLENIAQHTPELSFLPERENCSSLQASLKYNNRGRAIISCNGHQFQEYDQIVFVNHVPVVFEVKLRRWDSGKHWRRKQPTGGSKVEVDYCMKNNLRPEVYTRKLVPARDFFKCDVGYVLIVSKDQYQQSTRTTPHSIIDEFLHNNGKIVPFYTDRFTFREHVREKVKEFGYLLKEEQPPYSP